LKNEYGIQTIDILLISLGSPQKSPFVKNIRRANIYWRSYNWE